MKQKLFHCQKEIHVTAFHHLVHSPHVIYLQAQSRKENLKPNATKSRNKEKKRRGETNCSRESDQCKLKKVHLPQGYLFI